MSTAPFFSYCDALSENNKIVYHSLVSTYKKKGFGHFLATVFKIKEGKLLLFNSIQDINYLVYWVLQELKIRCIAWKLYTRLKNKVRNKHPAQNETLLDLATNVSDVENPVYVYSHFKYWVFSMHELKNIILHNLKQSDISEPSPTIPCNAYTNERFSPEQLMNIYLQIGHLKLHPYIHSYARRYFDLRMYLFYNKTELTNDATKTYLKSINTMYMNTISTYFNDNISSILQRTDIPLDMKRGIIRKEMLSEPMDGVYESPLYCYYGIHNKHKHQKKTPRRHRRAIRPPPRDIPNDTLDVTDDIDASVNQNPESYQL